MHFFNGLFLDKAASCMTDCFLIRLDFAMTVDIGLTMHSHWTVQLLVASHQAQHLIAFSFV